jgi:hypothetical protein
VEGNGVLSGNGFKQKIVFIILYTYMDGSQVLLYVEDDHAYIV